jgi:hypothetical protein
VEFFLGVSTTVSVSKVTRSLLGILASLLALGKGKGQIDSVLGSRYDGTRLRPAETFAPVQVPGTI